MASPSLPRLAAFLGIALVTVVSACASPTATAPTPTGRAPAATATATTRATTIATAQTVPPTTAATPAPSPSSTPLPVPTSPPPPASPTGAPLGTVGYLEGHVTIGPLTPVEREGVPTPTPSPQMCTSRGLAIAESGSNKAVVSFSFQPDCNYRVALPPGSYTVALQPATGIGGARNLTRTVTIEVGKTTRLDLDIDTGIR